MTTTMKWHGDRAKDAAREGGAEGLKEAAEIVFEASQRAVPEASGALKRSGKITRGEDGLAADISYGEGLSDNRAVIVHEKLEIRHPNGSAKYLENPTTEAAPRVHRAVADGIRRKLR